MMLILVFVLYLIGCVLAYGKLTAIFYEIDEKYMNDELIGSQSTMVVVASLGSWLSFLAAVSSAHQLGLNKYFFKWSYEDLRRRNK